MLIANMTRDAFEAACKQTDLAILPVGAVEQHGPHLPLGTDFFHSEELAKAAAERTGALVAPTLPYGFCRSTADFPGTLVIRPSTVRAVVYDVGAALVGEGLTRLVIVTGHAGGGHVPALIDAGERIRDEYERAVVAVVNVMDVLMRIHDETDLITNTDDGHAGEIETALIQHLRPELVDGTAPEEQPDFPKHILVRRPREFWPGGVWGNPAAASPEWGKRLFEAEVDVLVEIIDSVKNFAD